ncbi:MAG: SdrD B-like domain-containing protein, partial [Planctomycetota bacterium]
MKWWFIAGVACLATPWIAYGNGTETLGPTPTAPGTRLVGDGVGLVNQPGTITFSVPAGATVEQVFLYWNGFDSNPFLPGDAVILNGSINVSGTLIGGPTQFFGSNISYTYRADITSLNLIGPGVNNVTVQGKDFNRANNGASILAVINEGGRNSVIDVRDGQDLAFINFAPPLNTTVTQSFNFAPAAVDRTAELTLIAGSVEGPKSGSDPMRPNIARVVVGGVTTDFDSPLASTDGDEWDHVTLTVNVPAGAGTLTIQMLSQDCCATGNLPASFTWITAGLTILPPETGEIGDTVFCDTNDNGVQDAGEPGVPGVTVNLSCVGAGGSYTASATTDMNGNYLFTDVPPGACTVTLDVGTIPSDKEVGVCRTRVGVRLQPNQSFLDADFCVRFKNGEIGDTVYCDTNNNGVQDAGEPGVPGVM